MPTELVVPGRDIYAFSVLWGAYRASRRNRWNTVNQLRFEIDLEAHLLELQQELRTHTYRPGRSICFVTDGPKPREVFAAIQACGGSRASCPKHSRATD